MRLHPTLNLQRKVGNQAVGRLLQTKLELGRPGDRYEQEADRIAEHVMRMPDKVVPGIAGRSGSIQRKCAPCAKGNGPCPECAKDEDSVQREPLSATITPMVQRKCRKREDGEGEFLRTGQEFDHTPEFTPEVTANVATLSSGGRPLPHSVQDFFEPRFGYDFSQVRVHTDAKATRMAQSLNAQAFTSRHHIVIGSRYYKPSTKAGRRLLAHELTHVVQQRGTPKQHRHSPRERVGVVDSGGANPMDPSTDARIRLTQVGAPDISRAPLDIPDIMSDITRGMSTPSELFSWLQVRDERSGDVGHAAACPNNTCPSVRPQRFPPPDNPVPVDRSLPITAHFFPSFIRHTDWRALVIGGIHGDERPGYEMVEALVQELQQRPRVLAYHTLIIPRLNPGAIKDDLTGVTWYDRRCNRQVVDLNRNFPVAGSSHSSTDCPNTPNAPVQPETQGIIDVINQFQPHRIVSTHAITDPRSAGIYADPNTHPTATQLACSMAGRLVNPSDRPGNRLTSTSCNAVYPGDRPGALPRGGTLGRFAPTRSIPGQAIPVITVEAPEYHSLGRGTGARTREAFLRPLLSFVDDPASLTNVDAAIVRDIDALSLSARRLFLTGRLPTSNALYGRIRSRIQAQVTALNALRPAPPNRIRIISHQRTFSDPFRGASPQSKIVFEKFTLTGRKVVGWDTLPDTYFRGGNRSRGVNRSSWLAESSATRLDIILRFSAVPGASRHHWGTDVDFNSTSNADWAPASGSTRAGRFHALGLWLQRNANRVGFIKTYTSGRAGGHQEEAWHYSYEPIAGPIRSIYNLDVRLTEEIVDPIMADWATRAASASVTLPNDLRAALLNLDLSNYVNVIGPGL